MRNNRTTFTISTNDEQSNKTVKDLIQRVEKGKNNTSVGGDSDREIVRTLKSCRCID